MQSVTAELIGILLILFAVYRWRRRHFYELAAKLPGPKNQIPFFGVTHHFIGQKFDNYLNIFFNLFDFNEPLQKFWFGTKFMLISNTPEMFKTILTSPDCLKKPAIIYDCTFAPKSLLASNGSVQERHRKIFNNTMTPNVLNQVNPVLNEKIKRFLTKMDEKVGQGEFNIFPYAASCTMEALMKGNFEYDRDFYKENLVQMCER